MTRNVVAAGFGGQGVMLLGQILALAATQKQLNATWLPSYGPEQRGGTANCTVVVSDEEIGSPVVDKPMYVVIMNNPSMEKFEKMVEPNGTVILNSTLITLEPKRTDVNYLKVPANELAEQAGSQRSANMVMLGVIGWLWKDIFTLEELEQAMVEKVGDKRPQLVETNKKAIELGYEFAKNLV
ncbi:2-oxoacid:ferredoxin oxidoreductase subunit gamma [Coprothermobacter proteolyticus]|uniref:Ketoisovalerate oxidoreductase subunit VorA (VOR) (2-oxoisovalerate oxidoreductase alpha chain) (2-oxoisovalerateferredoxin reductase subunit alpha) n=1 Tax=Coprothermobacter proteolyticus (strain ATCC 35245 / DSM 5265 / OCM 4 / BT) TaxID=309798 RepID=B5Y8N7_COPPD|nr:2-oxoacid:acceptor oxidoreductase family protein [Coprothermobacter proteolyticus]ACI17155.1 2-oxoacid:ferredoxin oxidoreductase subunit gamma [Coprothermobacter proteolyticus DSM 5265]NLT83827.1 2-oxoacid:ferredoxin oxidoreductase subunit gamma [Coprothermobacter proteolyticus]HOK24157.1 2-oxoacid:acceptor oxidoreductase family protein [Coprothermobacter proteolyticus]HOL52772.1 2-oxoacid:acceptor oxidoreductase family protein [Coprothermobacter proteolyticus]HPO83434.1 2-oxoacid:acceptor 